jgi:hypothetical protein
MGEIKESILQLVHLILILCFRKLPVWPLAKTIKLILICCHRHVSSVTTERSIRWKATLTLSALLADHYGGVP